MHFAFMPYGKRECVERLLRDMEAQKHMLPMVKGKETKSVPMDSQVRVCPFGVYEYVCPKEDKDLVLNTLHFNTSNAYGLGKKITLLRNLLRYKKAPKFSTEKRYLWNQNHVTIIPIGIREDGKIKGFLKQDDGWTHEAI